MQYSLDGANYLPDIPTGTNACDYIVWYKVVGDTNHNDITPASIEATIAHNGDFGFTAFLTVDLGKKNNGLIANLLWYNEKTDELEHVDFDEIQSGKAELMFTHASEWAVVIDEEVLGEYDDVSSAAGITDNAETLPDSNAPIAVAVISFAGLVLAAVMAKKRKAE